MPKNTGIQESKPVEGPFSGMYIHQIKSQSLVLFGFKTGRDPLWSYCRDISLLILLQPGLQTGHGAVITGHVAIVDV
ncbi:hypothetical protein NADE_000685 [Nannochloris sp. 'desiccata']|nr:hypothetical protein NADE_000685 [Chlorella desiccata (nom. nud.)]